MKCNFCLRALRLQHNVSQQTLADLLGIKQTTYSKYELGKVALPMAGWIVLAEYYDVDMNYICGLTDEKKPFPR